MSFSIDIQNCKPSLPVEYGSNYQQKRHTSVHSASKSRVPLPQEIGFSTFEHAKKLYANY